MRRADLSPSDRRSADQWRGERESDFQPLREAHVATTQGDAKSDVHLYRRTMVSITGTGRTG